MMLKIASLPWLAVSVLNGLALAQSPQNDATIQTVLGASYDLSRHQAPTESRYFFFESSNAMLYISSGTTEPLKRYRFFLEVRPKGNEEQGLYHCHIKSYYLTIGDAKPTRVEGLSSYDYSFAPGTTGYDDKGQLFGISHADFQRAKVGGKALEKMEAFMLYMGLIDFHTFEALLGDSNVRKLTRIGQRAMLADVGRDLPVDLGDVVLKGSIQTMGESTVEAKGMCIHHDKPCVLYDYRVNSTVSMLMEPVPGVKIKMTGPSYFQGTITAEIETGLVSAADFTEHVIGTNYLAEQKLHDFVTRRDGSLKRISKKQYEREEAPGT